MSDLKTIKHKLMSDDDKVVKLLETIGCEYVNIEQRGNLVTAQLPEKFYSNNRRAVQIRMNEYLSCKIRNKPDFKGDVFNLISYIHYDKRGDELQSKTSLKESKKFICNLFGWTQFLTAKHGDVVVKDYTACLKELIDKGGRKKEVKNNPILPESTLDEFVPFPYKSWIKEGISYKTQKMYGIGFDLDTKRITIPIRNRFGNLVGVKGRIMNDEDDDRKYLYIYSCQNSLEWFNWHYAHQYILMDKKVYILEAEKSCMKLFDSGVYNTLAIGASDISDEQARMVKQLGLDVEIILCYDKGVGANEIKKQAEIFKGRKVSAMFDVSNLLNDKDAPIDKGIDVWNKLVENNIFEIKFE